MKAKKVTKAVFPVAGLGTRFLPATKSIPKEIMTLVDRPLIQYAIDEARAAGIKEFIFVTSRGKSALEDYFDNAPELESELRKKGKTELLEVLKDTNMDSGAIAYVRQNRPMGLGHAVWCARRLIGESPSPWRPMTDRRQKPCLQDGRGHGQTGGCSLHDGRPAKASSYGVLGCQVVAIVGAGDGESRRPRTRRRTAVIGRYLLSPQEDQPARMKQARAANQR